MDDDVVASLTVATERVDTRVTEAFRSLADLKSTLVNLGVLERVKNPAAQRAKVPASPKPSAATKAGGGKRTIPQQQTKAFKKPRAGDDTK